MTESIELRHFTTRLETNPDWDALKAALVVERDRLSTRLMSTMLDHADIGTLHALRGEIRGLNRVLSAPADALKKHEKRITA